jgi:excisionase family DNA binding protein
VSIVDQENKLPAPDLISIPEAARRVGLHADTVYRLCRAGHFPPAIQIGARWRVSVPRLERFLHDDLRPDRPNRNAGPCP